MSDSRELRDACPCLVSQEQPTGFSWQVQQTTIATACLVCCMQVCIDLCADRCSRRHSLNKFCISRPLLEAHTARAYIAQMVSIGSSGVDNIGEALPSLKVEMSQDMQSFKLSQHSTGASCLLEHKATNLDGNGSLIYAPSATSLVDRNYIMRLNFLVNADKP